ncbi:HNH endonuclease [endosymbiont 'TC1' of Trimyema compressum]|uniref:HNH endonuclease n=1 Tax=endosymbiont 'TC1' of Trimyema compressum TaxID=243899 RepID=UPI000A4C91F5|nr:HNH endonuclease [endosymbiont 'TC1' of Trimyema compressum]
MGLNTELKIGESIYNPEIVDIFKCGNMGGMRRSHKTKSLVLVCDHTKGFYDDLWNGDILHYTGMGKTGDQNLYGGQNKTLLNAKSEGVSVFLFEVVVKSQYVFLGEVELADVPYQEEQLDIKNKLRKVWIFPIRLKSRESVYEVAEQIAEYNISEKQKRLKG